MRRQITVDIDKLSEVLENPAREQEFQEVFSFVETITGHNFTISDLTQKNIENWNQKFDEALKKLLL
jgi:hypothetical protein